MAVPTFAKSKSEGVKSDTSMKAEGGRSYGGGGDSAEDSSNAGMGPTGSSRSYPKGGSTPGNTQSAPFNPQKQAAVDIYVGGVGPGVD